MKKTLTEIAQWLKVEGQLMEQVWITGVAIDSRKVRSGDLFIPFRGTHTNGHQYVRQAFERGACASLWLQDEPDPPQDLPLLFVKDAEEALQTMARTYRQQLTCQVVGVTGSNGKTSTKDLIAGVLAPYFKVQKTAGNLNTEIGLPLTILALDEDTEVAVLEMGMSGFGEISFLTNLAHPHYAVITNIGEAHLQDLGSREGIARAKFEIVEGLQPNGKLFYDGDEPLLEQLVQDERASLEAVSFGYQAEVNVRVVERQSGDNGSSFQLEGAYEGSFSIPVFGAHQVKNAVASILVAHELGLSKEQIRSALAQVQLTAMRMQPILMKSGALIINDAYNASPTSMKAACSFIQETTLRKEKWLVLGDMLELGEQERAYHEALADDVSDLQVKGICLIGSRMKWLYDRLKYSRQDVIVQWSEHDFQPIIELLQSSLNKDTMVLVKGSRGLALEQLIDSLITGEKG